MDPHVTSRPRLFRPSSFVVTRILHLQIVTTHIHRLKIVSIDPPMSMDIYYRAEIQGGDSQYANYLPDELLLQVLDWLPRSEESQKALAGFVLVSR